MSATAADRHGLRALRAFGLPDATVTPIAAGTVNEHWWIDVPGRRFVMRRYSTGRLAGGIPFEHEVLARLDAAAWPVAPPHLAPDGTSLVKVGGHYHALFPCLPGERLDDPARHGAVLARLHQVTATFSMVSRTSWPRLADYARRPFPELVLAWAAVDPDGAAKVVRAHGLVAADLGRPRAPLPTLVVHGDFHTGNLLFVDGQLSGILDFDFARPDWRVADVAIALGFLPPGAGREAFLAAYQAEVPLSPDERSVLPALVRAREIERLTFSLRRWRQGIDRADDAVRRDVALLTSG